MMQRQFSPREVANEFELTPLKLTLNSSSFITKFVPHFVCNTNWFSCTDSYKSKKSQQYVLLTDVVHLILKFWLTPIVKSSELCKVGMVYNKNSSYENKKII